MALAAVWVLRRQSAALRHAILLAALVRFAVPTGWLIHAGGMLARSVPAPAPAPRALNDFARLLLVTPGANAAPPQAHATFALADVVWLLWIAGGVVCLATWSRRPAHKAPAVRAPNAQETAAFLAARERFPGGDRVALRIAPADQGPAVWGCWRPYVTLPDGLAAQLSAPELAAVIVHELAHVRRRDNLWAAVAHAIVSAFWFHPLVWWMERRMLAERERACDDLVLLHGARPEDYAAGLLKVCRLAFAGPAAYAAASGSDLKSRMEQIMSADTNRSSCRTLRTAVSAFLLTVMMIPAGIGFLRAQQPYAELRRKRMTLMQQGKKDEATAVNREILAADPNDLDAREFVLSMRLGKDGCTQSIAELRAAAAEAPENMSARLDLGRAQAACGDAAEALKTLQAVVRLNPRFVQGWLELAKVQAAQQDFDAALKSAVEVLKIDPANRGGRLIQASAFTGKKQFDDARDVLHDMLRMEPDSADAWFELGRTCLAEGKYTHAEEAFQRVRRLEPANSRGLLGLAEVYMAQNRADDAIALLQYPGDVASHMALGNMAVRTARYDLAIAEFQQALDATDKNSPAAGDLYLRLGETWRRKGDFKSAAAALEKARALRPQSVMAVNTLALTLDAGGRMAEARSAYEDALKLDPRNGVALNNLAYLLSETGGDLDQALTYVQRAAQILPNLDEVRDTLGLIYFKKGLTDQAISTFSQLVSKPAAKSSYHYHLALALNQKGDGFGARRELFEALKNSPSAEESRKIDGLLRSLR
jgi:tetratricopeptide (TPR) repeat protein/Zn-dependent protease with chaperone function